MKVMAENAKPGQWYQNDDYSRLLCIGYLLFAITYTGDIIKIDACAVLTHLPNCTSWHWEEPKKEKKYRPFASMKEWWPHRNRWYRDGDGIVTRGWFSADTADRDFRSGTKFLNDDGTDSETFGVEV